MEWINTLKNVATQNVGVDQWDQATDKIEEAKTKLAELNREVPFLSFLFPLLFSLVFFASLGSRFYFFYYYSHSTPTSSRKFSSS